MTEALWQGRNALSTPETGEPYSHPTVTRDINALCSIGAKKGRLPTMPTTSSRRWRRFASRRWRS